jgi:lipopolysaccharide assembly outer membrane protein LptD (OstA)
MFTYKTPAFIPWQDGYTFPSTRNLTGLYFNENYTYLKHSMDFIFGPKMILSGFLDLTNDKDYNDSINKLGLKLIYDINNDFSVAGGLVYSEASFSVNVSGGYQFKDISAGNLKMNFKLVPSISLMVSGENTPVLHLINLGLHTYFN